MERESADLERRRHHLRALAGLIERVDGLSPGGGWHRDGRAYGLRHRGPMAPRVRREGALRVPLEAAVLGWSAPRFCTTRNESLSRQTDKIHLAIHGRGHLRRRAGKLPRRWAEYGGIRADQAKRLKALETENTRLKKLVADLSLDADILKEAASGNF